jgi:uncharacterized protein involved in propanediol utilization
MTSYHQVHRLSKEAQQVIHKYMSTIPAGHTHNTTVALLASHQQLPIQPSIPAASSFASDTVAATPTAVAATAFSEQSSVLPATQVLAAMVTGELPWEIPSWQDYTILQRESEYAAW